MGRRRNSHEQSPSLQKAFNMKYILPFILFFLLVTPVAAQTATPSPTSSQPTMVDQITDLKDRIASRVAQLKLVDKRGIIGVVQNTSSTQITIEDINKNTRFVDVDEITKFSSPSASGTFGISDITKGTKISVLGLYNKQSRRITARFITVDTIPTTLSGQITAVNEEEFTFKIAAEDGSQTTVDVENVTKTNVYTKRAEMEKAGFSRIEIGQRVFITGFPDKKEKLRMVATRIIIFPDLPKNPKVVVPSAQLKDDEEVVVSSGSGKKLTPLR